MRVDRAVEATAPTRVDLSGGALDVWPLGLFHRGAVAVTVAIDRRVWCRVSPRDDGVRFESKDSLARVEGADVGEVLAGENPPLAAFVLDSLGIATGVEVATRIRVPDGAGLGEAGALAAAVAAAGAAASGADPGPEAWWRLARDAETRWRGWPAGVRDALAALHGGALAVHLAPGGPRPERLAVDAAAVEECLLLASAGDSGAPGPGAWKALKRQLDGDPDARRYLGAVASASRRMVEALSGHRFTEVPGLWDAEREARGALAPDGLTPGVERILTLASEHGGAARHCGGGLVSLWATPGARGAGPREALEAALKEAAIPAFPFRADLRGLEVEIA